MLKGLFLIHIIIISTFSRISCHGAVKLLEQKIKSINPNSRLIVPDPIKNSSEMYIDSWPAIQIDI